MVPVFLISKMRGLDQPCSPAFSPPCLIFWTPVGQTLSSEMAFHLLVVHRQIAQPDLLCMWDRETKMLEAIRGVSLKEFKYENPVLTISAAKTRTNIYLIWRLVCPLLKITDFRDYEFHTLGISPDLLSVWLLFVFVSIIRYQDYCIVHNNSKVQDSSGSVEGGLLSLKHIETSGSHLSK